MLDGGLEEVLARLSLMDSRPGSFLIFSCYEVSEKPTPCLSSLGVFMGLSIECFSRVSKG